VPVPRELFIAERAAKAGTLLPRPCRQPAACLGQEPRIWIVGSSYVDSPYQAVTPAQAAVLRQHYRLSYLKRVRGLIVFLLLRR
jgi:mannosyltransferase